MDTGEEIPKRRLPWLAISIAGHLLVGGVFYYVMPRRDPIDLTKPEKDPTTLSRAQMEEVQAQLQEIAEDRLKRRVEELQLIEEEMAKIEAIKSEAYDAMAENMAEQARGDALQDLEAVLKIQDGTLTKQKAQTDKIATTMQEVDTFLKDWEELVTAPEIAP